MADPKNENHAAAPFAVLSNLRLKLPLRLCSEESGVILDDDGIDVATVDTNRQRTDEEAKAIAMMIVAAVNHVRGMRDTPLKVSGNHHLHQSTRKAAGPNIGLRMSRELVGKIVDDVFDGAIEDASVIEQIYAAIKKHETPAPQEQTMVTDEMIRVALCAFQSGDMDWSSQDEELMRFALEEAISASPMSGLLRAARLYVEDRLHRPDGEIDGSVAGLLSKIDTALATTEGSDA